MGLFFRLFLSRNCLTARYTGRTPIPGLFFSNYRRTYPFAVVDISGCLFFRIKAMNVGDYVSV